MKTTGTVLGPLFILFLAMFFPTTVFHEYLAGIIFSEFVILEISRVFNLAIPKKKKKKKKKKGYSVVHWRIHRRTPIPQ